MASLALAAGLAIWLVIGLWAPETFAQPQPDARATELDADALATILQADDLQTELPGYDAEAGSAAAGDRERRRRPSLGLALPPAWAAGLTWLTLLVGLAVIVWLVLQGLRQAPNPAGAAGSGDDSTPAGAVSRDTVAADRDPAKLGDALASGDWEDAEALAHRGEWAAALRLLLALTLRALQPRRVLPVAASTTGRELLGRASWSDAEESDLRRLVTAVEGAVFAGRPPEMDDFATARQAAHRLAGREESAP